MHVPDDSVVVGWSEGMGRKFVTFEFMHVYTILNKK